MPRNPTLADLPEHVRRQVRPQIEAQAAAALARVKCRRCGDTGRVTDGKGIRPCPNGCPSEIAVIRPSSCAPWSAAKRCASADGTPHASKMERSVFERLRDGLMPGEILLRQVRMPLKSIEVEGRRLRFLTVDFAILRDTPAPGFARVQSWVLPIRAQQGIEPGVLMPWWVRWIEAKGKRKSRDWGRGRDAFEKTWGKIEEVSA